MLKLAGKCSKGFIRRILYGIETITITMTATSQIEERGTPGTGQHHACFHRGSKFIGGSFVGRKF